MRASDFTEEEIAHLPQTDMVFDQPNLVVDQHEWLQEGYFIRDVCNPSTARCHQGGIPIPSGKLLVKKGGHYDLIDEKRS